MSQPFWSIPTNFTRRGVAIPATPGDMERIESAIGFSLPADYKTVMYEIGGFNLIDSSVGEFVISIENPYDLISFGKSLEEGGDVKLRTLLIDGIMPIGSNVGGHILCIADNLEDPQMGAKCISAVIIDNICEVDAMWDTFSQMLSSCSNNLSKRSGPLIEFPGEYHQKRIAMKRSDFATYLNSIG